MDLSKKIKGLLQNKFKPSQLEVINESYKHAGHREAGQAVNSHFRIEINKNFIEGTMIAKHRAIMEQIEDLMDNPIHAVEIKLL